MSHPFERWPATGRRRALLAVIGLATALEIILARLDGPLRSAGDGTIAFELAGSVERAGEIVGAWRSAGVLENAAFLNGLDFLFALLYAAALAGTSIAAASAWRRAGRPRFASVGIVAAWLVTAAAGFDWIENIGLTFSLLDEPSTPWPEVAMVAAVAKFTGIAAALAFSLSGLAASLTRRH